MNIKYLKALLAFGLLNISINSHATTNEIIKDLLDCNIMSKKVLKPHGVLYSKNGIKENVKEPNGEVIDINYKLKPFLQISPNINLTQIKTGSGEDTFYTIFYFKEPYQQVREEFYKIYNVDLGKHHSFNRKKDKESSITATRHLRKIKNRQTILLCYRGFVDDSHLSQEYIDKYM